MAKTSRSAPFFRLLQLVTLFCGSLAILGGTVLKTSHGKIEIGSLDPWVWALGVLVALAWRFDRESFDTFLEWTGGIANAVTESLRPRRDLWLVVGFVFGGVFLAHLMRHLSFGTHFYDMGMVHQALFHPYSGGKLLHADLSPKGSYLVDHFCPALLLLAPITAWFHSNEAVFAIQAFLLGIGVFLLVRKGPLAGRPALWACAALILVCNRSLRNSGIWDFREDVIGYFFLILAILMLASRRFALYFAALAGFILTKEHLGVVGLGILAPIFWDRELNLSRRERGWLAAGTAALLIVWTGIVFGVIFPHLKAGVMDVDNISFRMREYGATPRDVLLTVVTSPQAWWSLAHSIVFRFHSWKYAILLLAPYLYFGRKGWPWLLAGSLGILVNVASGSDFQRSLNYHYDVAFLPLLMMGVLRGIERIGPSRRDLLLGVLLAFAFSGRWPMFHVWEHWPSSGQARDVAWLESVPCPEIVAGDFLAGAKLTRCPGIRVFGFDTECGNVEEKFLQLTAGGDTSRLPGHSARNASLWVLDRSQPCEASLAESLSATRDGRVVQVSPSNRFVLISARPYEPVSAP